MTHQVMMVAYYFPPQNTIAVHRTLRFLRHLPRFGWRTSVLASEASAPDNLLDGIERDVSLLNKIPSDSLVERVPLHRIEDQIKMVLRQFDPRRTATPVGVTNPQTASTKQATPTLRQLTSELLFGIPDNKIGWRRAAIRAGIEMSTPTKPDAIFSTGPPFTSHLVGLGLSQSLSVPLVIDFRDPWSRSSFKSRGGSSFAKKKQTRLERICVERAKIVILNTLRLRDEFRQHYVDQPSDKFVTITNGCDLAPVVAARPTPTGKLRLLHPGSLYAKRDPTIFLKALRRVIQQGIEVEFTQVGKVDPQFQMERQIRELDLSRHVRLVDQVTHDEVLKRMSDTDAFVLLQPGTPLQVPGKLFEMLAFGRPILTVAEPGETADIVERFDLGIVGSSTDVDHLARAIATLQKSHSRWDSGAGFDEAMKAFDSVALTERLAEVLQLAATGLTPVDHSTSPCE